MSENRKNILELSAEAAASKNGLLNRIKRLEADLAAANAKIKTLSAGPAAAVPGPAAAVPGPAADFPGGGRRGGFTAAATPPARLSLAEIEARLAKTTDPRERYELARLANESAGHVAPAADPAAMEKALEAETDPRRRFEMAQALNLAAGFHH